MISNYKDIDTRTLPYQAQMLIRLCGIAATTALLRAKGGSRLRVPLALKKGVSELEIIMGKESAQQLVNSLGGTAIDLPKADKILQQIRKQHVYELADKDMSATDIAAATDYTQRYVQMLLAQREEKHANRQVDDNDQFDLFA